VRVDFDQVELDTISRHYGRRRALHDVSFTCHAREIVALVGPNGAGKSTLLAILSTLLTPTSGRVRYGAWTAKDAGPLLRARVGWLGHDLQLYPELTGRENLEFFAGLLDVADRASRIDLALHTSGLYARADDLVSSYSRGMRQRLALERALLHEPRLVLLDEPFTGLDRRSADSLTVRLRTLAARDSVVLLATHDFDLADGVLDRAVILRDGRLVETASGSAWREAYRAAVDRS
jgi:heme exporter protein A